MSSVAILATLVYLALQMQQNTAAIRAQTHQAMIEVDLQLIAKPEANPDTLLARFSEGELSPERKIRLNANLLSALRSREFMWFQYQNGVLEETSWRSYQKTIPVWLGTKRTRAWWNKVGRGSYDPGFVEMVDKLIEGQPYTDYYDKLLALE